SKETYQQITQEISTFLHGGYREIKNDLTNKMLKASEELNFERAQEYRDSIKNIEAVMEKQKVVLNEKIDIDIFNYSYNKRWKCSKVYYILQEKLMERAD